MVKKSLKIVLLLSFLFIFPSCGDIKSTYQRQNITASIKKICKQEYNLNVKVEEVEDTLWIYTPFKNLIDEQGNYTQGAQEKIGNIMLSLHRVILSTDNPPEFYVFVASDIEKAGADLYLLGFVPDIVKYELQFISRNDFLERRFMNLTKNPGALGDTQGVHIQKFNLDAPTFIATLIEQKLVTLFSSPQFSTYFKIHQCRVWFEPETKNFYINLNIEKTNYKPFLPNPFNEAIRISRYFISEIYHFNEFSFIRIEDKDSGKIQTLNKRALDEVRLD